MLTSVSVRVSHRLEKVRVAQAAMDDLARTSRLPARARGQLQVVLDELLSNVIRHGGLGQGSEPIHVALTIDGRTVTIALSDDASPFDPSVTPAGPADHRDELGGRGLDLVHRLVDRIDYRRTTNGQNEVLVTKHVDGFEGDDVVGHGLTIEEHRGEGNATLTLHGRIDSGNAAELTDHLTGLVRSGFANLTIDFQGIEYLTSAGFRALLVATDAAEAAGGDLRLKSLSPDVRELFALTGLEGAFMMA
ncbi:MAG: ATP-binding protein [Pseudomonadota bacterium]